MWTQSSDKVRALSFCWRCRFSVSAIPPWVSCSNPDWDEMGQDSAGEDGRKTGDGERDRVKVFCGKCGNET